MNNTRLVKSLVICLAFSFCWSGLFSQVQPAAYQGTTTVNYVRSLEAVAPISNESSFLTAATRDVRSTTAYIDGIGRTIQQVVKKGSLQTGSSATDMVAPAVFDQYGREKAGPDDCRGHSLEIGRFLPCGCSFVRFGIPHHSRNDCSVLKLRFG